MFPWRRFVAMLVVPFVLALLPGTVRAATCTWTGPVSGNWNDAANWSCAKAPGPGDSASVGSLATVQLTTDVAVDSLVIDSGVITGAHSLFLLNPLVANAFAGPSELHTQGSHIPALIASPAVGSIFRLTDPALTLSSLAAITVSSPAGSNGSTILDVGERSIPTLAILNGNFAATASFTVTGSLAWSGASLSNYSRPATLTLASGAAMTISDGLVGHTLYMPFVNAGVVTWLGTQSIDAGPDAAWTNYGAFNVRTTRAVGSVTLGRSNVPFTNFGVVHLASSGEVELAADFTNYGLVELASGLLSKRWNNYVQNAGHTQLSGGGLGGAPACCGLDNFPIYLYGGSLAGSGTITGGIENVGGTVMLDGRLIATGRYSQGITGTLQVTITDASTFGSMDVVKRANTGNGGVVRIAGNLIANHAPGFQPASGDRFVVINGLSATGSFQQSSGNMAPAFGGYAGGAQVLVAEPAAAAIIQAKPDRLVSAAGSQNGYTVAVLNPTTQTLTATSIAVSLPVSFTYRTGSTGGVFTADPVDFLSNGRRTLQFNRSFDVLPGERRALHFGIDIAPELASGAQTIDVEATTRLNGSQNTINIGGVAPIDILLGAASEITIGGGALVQQGDVPSILFPRSQLAAGGLSLRVKLTCPPALEPCGNLLGVYVAQEVNGRYLNIVKLQPEAPLLTGADATAQYGFWTGFIPGAQFIAGVPEKLFPDWDAHRPCIAYDGLGYGLRPIGCVGGGDPIGIPELYDPSGVIRSSQTGQPISGATVTLHRVPQALPDTRTQPRDCRTVDTRGGAWSGIAPAGVVEQPGFTPPQISPDVNPQVTASDGRYGWNVVTGCWYVTVNAPGYQPVTSALVGVPPEVTDLDVVLDPAAGGGATTQHLYLPLLHR